MNKKVPIGTRKIIQNVLRNLKPKFPLAKVIVGNAVTSNNKRNRKRTNDAAKEISVDKRIIET